MPIGACTARSGRTSSAATDVVRMEPGDPQILKIAGRLRVSGSCIWRAPGPCGPRPWHGGCFDSPDWGRNMSFRPFTSESYSEHDRLEAWRDVLGAVGLQPQAAQSVQTGHATASR